MYFCRSCSLVAILLAACSQSGTDIEYVRVEAGNAELQEAMIDEFESRGIDYRVTEEGTLEADFERADDISEIGNRVFSTYLPNERSFSINPDVLADFRARLDEESIPYRSATVSGLEWTIVEEGYGARALEIQDLVFEVYLEKQ